jgi:hypothetical protein
MRLITSLIFTYAILSFVACGSGGSSSSDSPDDPRSSGLTNVGYAPFNLTAANFNCTGFLDATQVVKHLHIAFLYNTFGNNFTCLENLIADPRLETLEVNLINEPGHRNGRLGSYEFLASEGDVQDYDSKLRSQDAALKQRFAAYVAPLQSVLQNLDSSTQLLINPGLESNVSPEAGAVLVSWTRELFPNARVVWNPLNPSQEQLTTTAADLIEGHGPTPNISAPCVYNMDGTDVSYPFRAAIGEADHREGTAKNWVQSGPPLFQLIEELANRCEVAFVWSAEGNGIDARNSNFVDPRSRNHNISTDVYRSIFSDIASVHTEGRVYTTTDYSQDELSVESTCSQVRTDFADGAKSGRLLKQSEFRDRGGVVILSRDLSSARNVQIVHGTEVVDVYTSSGPYHDGRPLFRSSVSPTKYPFNTYLTLEVNSEKICYKIANPRVRID